MPSIVWQSRIRGVSDYCSLNLSVRHHLLAGDPSRSVCRPKETRFPDNVDILLTSNLVINLSGDLDGEEISAEEIYTSELAQNLVDYLQLNATQLGLNTVPQLKMDKDSGLNQIVLTPSRQQSFSNPQLTPVHILLVAIDLRYSWITREPIQAKSERANHPFTKRLSLPYKTVLQNVIGRFVRWQLVKRYPLIFGRWCQQLDLETSYFSGVADSILRVVRRSPNNSFRSKCRRIIKFIHNQRTNAQFEAARSLATYLGASDDDIGHSPSGVTDEDALCYALERIYRTGMSRPQFKGLASMPSTMDCEDDKDLACNHIPSLIEAPSMRHLSDIIIWDDVFKDVLVPISPPSPLADACHLRSDGENEFPIDMELDHHHVILGEEGQDCEELLESTDEFAEGLSVAPHLQVNQNAAEIFPLLESTRLSPLLDLDDSDGETGLSSLQATSQDRVILSEDPHIGEGFCVSNICVSHIPHTDSSLDQNSQDELPQRLDVESGSQAIVEEPQASPSNSGLLQLSEYWPQLSAGSNEYDHDTFATDEAPDFIQEQLVNEDDFEFGFLSDSTCNDSKLIGYSFDENPKLFENSGDSVAVEERPGSPDTTLFSDQVTTLHITWPSHIELEDQMRKSLNTLEDSDEELWIDEDRRCGGDDSDEMLYIMELDLVDR